MDFIFSTQRGQVESQLAAFQAIGLHEPAIALQCSGTWGSLVATGSHYQGMNPLETSQALTIVLGDPLLAGIRPGDPENRTARTRQIEELLGDETRRRTVRPHHPGALLRVCKYTGSYVCVTDAFGAAPLYFHRTPEADWISSSPDLIAHSLGLQPSSIALYELLINQHINFPYTAYQDVYQLLPGRLYENSTSDGRTWWEPRSRGNLAIKRIEDFHELIESNVRDTVKRIARQVTGRGIATLSAGRDAAGVCLVAREHLDFEARCLLASRNNEWLGALENARRIGLELTFIERSATHYTDVLLDSPLKLTSQNHWLGAHYANSALRVGSNSNFVLGGYAADSLLKARSLNYVARSKFIASCPELAARHPWSLSPISELCSTELSEEIYNRRKRGFQLLGIDPDDSFQPSYGYPITKQISAMHLSCALRNAAQYEPFTTDAMLDLSMAAPQSLKDDLRENPVGIFSVPDHRSLRHSTAMAVYQLMRRIAVRLPLESRWNAYRFSGPWSQRVRMEQDPRFNTILNQVLQDEHTPEPIRNGKLQLDRSQKVALIQGHTVRSAL